MPYVYSTATNDGYYCDYEEGGADLPTLKRKILIKGGANRGGKGLITPLGVGTRVTDEELEFLEKHEAFNRHKKRGFLTVVKAKKAPDADKVAKDMTEKDASAPLTADDYKRGGRMGDGKTKAPSVGEEKPSKKKDI